MASILDRYGIKEVADVTFYEIDESGKAGAPVLFLDTLKVSTIEQTAESVSARGGKGNSELIVWDYGKEITLSIEDALFSSKSLAMMYGVSPKNKNEFKAENTVNKTVRYDATTMGTGTISTYTVNGKEFTVTGSKFYSADGQAVTYSESWTPAEPAYAVLTLTVAGQNITISADSFPGTYYVTGDTYARSETTGKDEDFQFIIPKAKMLSEVTLTMEAEGDPSTFSMNMKVLRPANGEMMKLVQYGASEA